MRHHGQPDIERPLRVGIFSGIVQADEAIVRLLDAGYPKDRIVVVAPESIRKHYAAFHAAAPGGSHTVRAAGAGGAIGAVLGGIIAAATVVGTGGAALVIAGPLVAGAAAGGVWGGFIGAMLTRGFEEEAAHFYDQALREGKILVGIEAKQDDRQELGVAAQILEAAGAEPLPLRKG